MLAVYFSIRIQSHDGSLTAERAWWRKKILRQSRSRASLTRYNLLSLHFDAAEEKTKLSVVRKKVGSDVLGGDLLTISTAAMENGAAIAREN